jgi:hypothetical protein
MEEHKGNSRMASGWSCFHNSAPTGKVYNDGKANLKTLQEIPLLPPHLPRTSGESYSMPPSVYQGESFILASISRTPNQNGDGHAYAVPKIGFTRLAHPGAKPRAKSDTSSTPGKHLSQLHPVHGCMQAESRGSHYSRLKPHATLGMAVQMAAGYTKGTRHGDK